MKFDRSRPEVFIAKNGRKVMAISVDPLNKDSLIKVFTSNNGKLVLLVVLNCKIITSISSMFACLSQAT